MNDIFKRIEDLLVFIASNWILGYREYINIEVSLDSFGFYIDGEVTEYVCGDEEIIESIYDGPFETLEELEDYILQEYMPNAEEQ